MPVSKYSADEVTLNMLKRFNLSMHTIGGKEYAFYGKRSGDLFNYALDIKDDFTLVKAYAVEAKVLESKFRDIMYEMRSSPAKSKINNVIIRDFVVQLYKRNEKEVDKVVKSALDENLTQALSDKEIYYSAFPELNSSLGRTVNGHSVNTSKNRYAAANPFNNTKATFEEIFALLFSQEELGKSQYINNFITNFVGVDIIPSLSKDILNRFIGAGKSKSFSMEESEIKNLVKKYSSKIEKYLANLALKDYINALVANKKVMVVDNPSKNEQNGDVIEVEPTFRGYAKLYRIIKKFAQPSGDQSPSSGDQSKLSGDLNESNADDDDPLVFDKKVLSQQLRLVLAEYLSDNYIKKDNKNPETNMGLFDSFIAEISDMVGVLPQENTSNSIINNVKQVIDSEVQTSGGISNWISKEDLEDTIKVGINSGKFLKFLKDNLIPAEQEDPSDKTNIFYGLTGKVVVVDTLGSHVVFISQMSNTDGVPTYILNSRSTFKKALDIYHKKYR